MKLATKLNLEMLRSPKALAAIQGVNAVATVGFAVLRHTAYLYLTIAVLRQYDEAIPKKLDDAFVLQFFSEQGLILAIALGALIAGCLWFVHALPGLVEKILALKKAAV